MVFIGPVLFPAGIDPGSTQTAVCVFGPGGGKINVPPMLQGETGPAPELRNINYTDVDYGDALPNPPAQFVPVVPGVYDLNLAVREGKPGEQGDVFISDALDFEGPPVGNRGMIYNAATGKWQPCPFPFAGPFNLLNIPNTGTTAPQVRTLATLQVSALPFAWTPKVFAKTTVEGTANTQVDLVARLGGNGITANSTAGAQLARAGGPPGSFIGTTPWQLSATPDFGGLLSQNYGQVAAGQPATIYLNTEQQASTQDGYSTSATTLTLFVDGSAPIAA